MSLSEANGAATEPGSAIAPQVMALILTYASPGAAARCVEGLAAQSVRPGSIRVIDNASPDPVVIPRRPSDDVDVQVLRLPRNVGPAGGHAAGLRAFAQSGLEWAWVMDDDTEPDRDALARLLAEADALDGPGLVQPTIVDAGSGEVGNTQGWCGVLIHRDVVRTVGLPNEALFWWTEDTEYLQWRIRRAGFPFARCDEAVVRVHRQRASAHKPAWKYYYEARNQVYHRLWVQQAGRRPAEHRSLTLRVRAWRAGRSVVSLAARIVARDRDEVGRKLVMVARGAIDGVRGRLGHVVVPDEPDRPTGGPSRG